MTTNSHDLARAFIAGLAAGRLPEALVTDDLTAATTTTPRIDRATYLGGIALLGGLFAEGIAYTIDSITAEDDRIAIEAHACATLPDGDLYENRYVFILRVRDGRIAAIAEHFDPAPVRERIAPLVRAALARPA